MSWMQPPAADTCVVCGEPLTGKPYIVVDYPSVAHTDCADKEAPEDVTADELPWLRKLYRDLEALLREVTILGKWVVTQRRAGVSRRIKTVYEFRKRKRDLIRKLSHYSPRPRVR